MGKAIMGAVVSLDGFIADSRDEVGPLFDWYGNGPTSPGASRAPTTSFGLRRHRPTSCGATTATRRRWSSEGVCST